MKNREGRNNKEKKNKMHRALSLTDRSASKKRNGNMKDCLAHLWLASELGDLDGTRAKDAAELGRATNPGRRPATGVARGRARGT